MFVAFHFMFRATMYPSSGENTVPMRHLVFVTLYRWLTCMQGVPPCIPDSHLYRVTNTRCRIGTVFPPYDGHIVARNMKRKAINILRKFVHQFGSIYKRLYKDARPTKHKRTRYNAPAQILASDPPARSPVSHYRLLYKVVQIWPGLICV